jgi:uncharacterized protein YdiU (UPF0061 family)
MEMIGVKDFANLDQDYLAHVLSGSMVEDGCIPLAHCYCGF